MRWGVGAFWKFLELFIGFLLHASKLTVGFIRKHHFFKLFAVGFFILGFGCDIREVIYVIFIGVKNFGEDA
jgi:hypothetical protein